MISAPSSQKTFGATLYAAPLAQSITILRWSNLIVLGKVAFENSKYLEIASSTRLAIPIFPAFGKSLISMEFIKSSISDCLLSDNLYPSGPNSLNPLSSKVL